MFIHRACLYIDLDHVVMEFYKNFRKHNYTSIIIKNIHPLDVNYKTYNSDKKIKSLVDECCIDSNSRFWLNINVTSVGKFYWNRLKEFQDRIYFYTISRSKAETEYKLLWLSSYLKMYDSSRLLVNVNILKYHRSLLYHNILITNDNVLADKWEKLEGIGLFDLGKRSVASYYLDKKIINYLKLYSGNNYISDIPDLPMRRHLSKTKEIISITLDELNNLS